MGDFYVIGANTAFWIAHKIIKPFLAKKTREKIKLVNKHEELRQWFEEDQIFEEYGGNKKYSYDPYGMWGLPKDGEEEKEDGPGGGFELNENNTLDLDEIIKQQY